MKELVNDWKMRSRVTTLQAFNEPNNEHTSNLKKIWKLMKKTMRGCLLGREEGGYTITPDSISKPFIGGATRI